MRHILARVLIALGAALVGLGRRLERQAPPAAKIVVCLPRRQYRPAAKRRRFDWFTFVPATG